MNDSRAADCCDCVRGVSGHARVVHLRVSDSGALVTAGEFAPVVVVMVSGVLLPVFIARLMAWVKVANWK